MHVDEEQWDQVVQPLANRFFLASSSLSQSVIISHMYRACTEPNAASTDAEALAATETSSPPALVGGKSSSSTGQFSSLDALS